MLGAQKPSLPLLGYPAQFGMTHVVSLAFPAQERSMEWVACMAEIDFSAQQPCTADGLRMAER